MTTAKRKSNNRWIWLTALLLFVSVAATTVCVLDRFDSYAMDDSGALPLVPTNEAKEEVEQTPRRNTIFVEPERAGFEVSDDGQAWGAMTDIELFKLEDNKLVIETDGEEKIIAPGTENTFVFKVKNTGNVAMDYDVAVEAFFTPEDTIIPIQGSIRRYDGEWVAGNETKYVDIIDTKHMSDSATLGAGRYIYYTLNWIWPYEQGLDELDTMLGNQATRETITLTLRIKTIATLSSLPDDDNGIKAPSTGDTQSILLWVALGVVAACLLGFLLYFRKKDDDEEEEQPADEEDNNCEKE